MEIKNERPPVRALFVIAGQKQEILNLDPVRDRASKRECLLPAGRLSGKAEKMERCQSPEKQGARHAYPPAIAPMTKNGSLPFTIASGNGVSGDSSDRSSPQMKKRTIGRRFNVP